AARRRNREARALQQSHARRHGLNVVGYRLLRTFWIVAGVWSVVAVVLESSPGAAFLRGLACGDGWAGLEGALVCGIAADLVKATLIMLSGPMCAWMDWLRTRDDVR